MTAFVRFGSFIGPKRHSIMLSIVRFVQDTIVLPSEEYVSCTKRNSAKTFRMSVVRKEGGFVNIAVLG